MPQISRLSARDVMQTDLATLSPDDTLETALSLFEESRIGGAPVIDPERKLVGVLSLSDLTATETLRGERAAQRHGTFDMSEPADEEQDDEADRSELVTLKDDYSPEVLGRELVGDRMTRDVISVTGRTTLAKVCEAMVRNHIHRVFVTEDDRLAGVISTFDVVRCVAAGSRRSPARARQGAAR